MDEVKLTPVDNNYIEQINELKTKMETMVAGEEYNKVLVEHKRLTQEYVTKRPASEPEVIVYREPQVILRDLNKREQSNRDYVKTALEYRNSVMSATGADVFTDVGNKGPGPSTPDSIEVAEAFEKMLEESNSPAEFNYRLEQTLKDDANLVSMLRAKRSKK